MSGRKSIGSIRNPLSISDKREKKLGLKIHITPVTGPLPRVARETPGARKLSDLVGANERRSTLIVASGGMRGK
jgi:hypothetical protein